VVDLKRLSDLMRLLVVDRLDHKNLNLDVDFMTGKMASCENLVSEVWNILFVPIAKLSPGIRLYRLKLQETPKNHVEYMGPGVES